MPDLPEITQVISASVVEYIDALTRASEAAVKFAEACGLAMTAVDDLQGSIDDFATATMTANLESAASATEAVRNAAAGAAGAENDLADATYRTTRSLVAEGRLLDQVAHAADDAALAKGFAGNAETDLAGASALAAAALKLENAALGDGADAAAKAAASGEALAGPLAGFRDLLNANGGAARFAANGLDALRVTMQGAEQSVAGNGPLEKLRWNLVADGDGAQYLGSTMDQLRQTLQAAEDAVAANARAAGPWAMLRLNLLRDATAADYLGSHMDALRQTLQSAVTATGGASLEGLFGPSEVSRMEQFIAKVREVGTAFSAWKSQLVSPAILSFFTRWGTLIHWVAAGGAELLAVLLPAIVALGSAMLVALPGAQSLAIHMRALYDATEATYNSTGKSIGNFLGLGSAMQNAQNAAKPQVYELLGSALNAAGSHMHMFAQAGAQVIQLLDRFAAKVNVDLTGGAGAKVRSLLSGMVTDLAELGQIITNVGHAILNFAAAMPGLAHVLLAVADGISRVILFVSELPPWLITAAMGLEEMYRWGGLVMSMMVRLIGASAAMDAMGATGFVTRFGAALATLVSRGGMAIQWIGQLLGRIAPAEGLFARAAAGVETFGSDVAVAAGAMSPLLVAGIAAAVAVLGYLIYKLATAKDATQQWIAATNKSVAAASDLQVLSTISDKLAQVQIKLASATKQAAQGFSYVQMNRAPFGTMAQSAQQASNDVASLRQEQQHLIAVGQTVLTNTGLLAAHFHVSAVAALALANAAGINLQTPLLHSAMAMKLAEQQVLNLERGLGAMQAPAGIVGADMTYLGVASALAATKVQQVNQAFDQWISTITGGMSAMSQLQTALHGMSKDTSATGAALSGAIGGIRAAASSMTYTLHGMSQNAMQSWQQFTQAVNTGAQSIDFLRTGMAAGVVSGQLFTSTIRGMVGEMLPFTQGNRTAVAMLSQLAHAAGGPTTTSVRALAHWAGVRGHAAALQYAAGIRQATIAMSNLSKVAQNLSAVVGSQLDQAMASQIIKVSGVTTATDNYIKAVKKYGPNSVQAQQAQQKLNQDYATATKLQQEMATGITTASRTIQAQLRADEAALQTYRKYLENLTSQTWTVRISQFISTSYAGPGSAGHHVGSMTAGTGTGGGAATGGGKHAGVLGGGVLGGGVHSSVVVPPSAGGGGGLHPSLAAALAGAGGGGGGESVTHLHLTLPSPHEWTGATQTYVLQKSRRNGRNNLSLPPGRY